MAVVIWEPNTPTELGCAIINKGRTVIGQAAICGAIIKWPMKDHDGYAIDLDQVAGEESNDSISIDVLDLKVRFGDICGGTVIAEVEGSFDEDQNAVFSIPDEVCQNPGIYKMSIAAFEDDEPVAIDNGLLSLERNLWATEGVGFAEKGPPTIREIRIALRDFATENRLLRDHEFDIEEISESIAGPVRYWNEQPPCLRRYCCTNFPWRHMWMEAIKAQLLEISAQWYMRNDAQGPTNVIANDMAKLKDYLMVSQIMMDRWKAFVYRKKIELNAGIWSVGG